MEKISEDLWKRLEQVKKQLNITNDITDEKDAIKILNHVESDFMGLTYLPKINLLLTSFTDDKGKMVTRALKIVEDKGE